MAEAARQLQIPWQWTLIASLARPAGLSHRTQKVILYKVQANKQTTEGVGTRMVETMSSRDLPFREATVPGKGRGLLASRGLLPGQVSRHGTEQAYQFLMMLLNILVPLNS